MYRLKLLNSNYTKHSNKLDHKQLTESILGNILLTV